MGDLLRDLERPNWLPPSSPEIILDADGIPTDAFEPGFEDVSYFVQPWIFTGYFAPIPQEVEVLPDIERVPWTDDQRLPQ